LPPKREKITAELGKLRNEDFNSLGAQTKKDVMGGASSAQGIDENGI
jgi:hypothetical protein